MDSKSTQSMSAYVINEPGGAEKLIRCDVPVPACAQGSVLIRIRALGLNRSEWFTRRGESPNVKFPRVLGIECVGEVADGGGTDLGVGQTVAAMMGGMGRDFDGSYAQYTSVPRANVFALNTQLPWQAIAALPETLQTVHGSLYTALQIDRADNILIRGGSSSIGLAAIALSQYAGLTVTATTRDPTKQAQLQSAGAARVLIDNGNIHDAARALYPEGFDCVLELIGTSTLVDSLRTARRGGIVCMTGILGGEWSLRDFRPMDDVPTAVSLTSYSGNASDISELQLQRYVEMIEFGDLTLKSAIVFPFSELADAHRLMDSNTANAKIVILVD
ncbi:MAG: NADPH2:quinone reductase [Gammaproteobacteria bacterium]|jgi:NADPH2:quinone reductase